MKRSHSLGLLASLLVACSPPVSSPSNPSDDASVDVDTGAVTTLDGSSTADTIVISADAQQTQGTIGAAGGTIAVKGFSLQIPAGALDKPVTISCSISNEQPPAGHMAYSPVFSCLPAGLTFAKPATAAINLTSGDPTTAALYWTDATGSHYELHAGAVSAKVITAGISHFSSGYAGHNNPCGQYLQTNPEHCGSRR